MKDIIAGKADDAGDPRELNVHRTCYDAWLLS